MSSRSGSDRSSGFGSSKERRERKKLRQQAEEEAEEQSWKRSRIVAFPRFEVGGGDDDDEEANSGGGDDDEEASSGGGDEKETELRAEFSRVYSRLGHRYFDEKLILYKVPARVSQTLSDLVSTSSTPEEMYMTSLAHVFFSDDVCPDMKPLVSRGLASLGSPEETGCLCYYISTSGLASNLAARYGFTREEIVWEVKKVRDARRIYTELFPAMAAKVRDQTATRVRKRQEFLRRMLLEEKAEKSKKQKEKERKQKEKEKEKKQKQKQKQKQTELPSCSEEEEEEEESSSSSSEEEEEEEGAAPPPPPSAAAAAAFSPKKVRIICVGISKGDRVPRISQALAKYKKIPTELLPFVTRNEDVMGLVDTSSLQKIDSIAFLAMMSFTKHTSALKKKFAYRDFNYRQSIHSAQLAQRCEMSRAGRIRTKADSFLACSGAVTFPKYMYIANRPMRCSEEEEVDEEERDSPFPLRRFPF